ncbi:flagellar basal body L-ring protein FlgH [Gimesia panareensis]|uniref:Flagellar L-ring protein n=1 Tax=Gimesia panareensis TaxID=2527978 RepID=A0A517Q1X9_9PLAN|nr:flagellar basal body L-ring protein FlgH [Gimesia panareensis]QDT25628.1 Flagellar L-ring protein precursor [Gimesia panareensis]QDU48574.1 Flagellar L-ring protein precursor [Gimesia panareensis]
MKTPAGIRERTCQQRKMLAALREAISLGCIVLLCSSAVRAQSPAVQNTVQANQSTAIRSTQGTSDLTNLEALRQKTEKSITPPERLAARMNQFEYSSEELEVTSSLANTFGQGDLYTTSPKPPLIRDYSLIYVPAPEPIVVKVHDIITIMVDEKSSVTIDSRFNRNRTETLKAELKEFLRIDNAGNLAPAALDSPKIDTQLQGRLQSKGQVADREGIQYRIAATVVDIRPNGNLILEARKSIRSNRDVWEYRLTGEIRSKDVNRDNTALSENIANLDIVKHQRGKVYQSTKRPWGVVLYDWFFPF